MPVKRSRWAAFVAGVPRGGRCRHFLPLLDSMWASTEALDTRSYLPGLYESISPDLMRWYVLFRPWQSSKPKNFDPQFRKKDVIKSAITTLTNP